MSSPIIIIRNAIQAPATVDFSVEHGIHVKNPDGSIVATGFPSYDYAYGWLEAMKNHKE